ncbi:MAG TPA: TadE/TadG family type IV pilus assembly protein [Gemmata sp.]|nr:TadE/TadG family type IV pilus assembly protein [Gemmata sp.]
MRTHRSRHARRGLAAVELAVLLPFLAYIFVIGVDWARLLYYTITIENCARSGAQYASDPTTASESAFTSVTDAALSSAPGLSPTPTVLSAPETVDGRPSVRVTVSMPFKTITNFPGVPRSETLVRSVSMRIVPVAPDYATGP